MTDEEHDAFTQQKMDLATEFMQGMADSVASPLSESGATEGNTEAVDFDAWWDGGEKHRVSAPVRAVALAAFIAGCRYVRDSAASLKPEPPGAQGRAQEEICSDCDHPKDDCRCEDWIEEDDAAAPMKPELRSEVGAATNNEIGAQGMADKAADQPIGDLMYERYQAYCDLKPKRMMTYSGWIRQHLIEFDSLKAVSLTPSEPVSPRNQTVTNCNHFNEVTELPPVSESPLPVQEPQDGNKEVDDFALPSVEILLKQRKYDEQTKRPLDWSARTWAANEWNNRFSQINSGNPQLETNEIAYRIAVSLGADLYRLLRASLAAPELPVRPHRYDKENPLHDLEGWIVFYGQQAQRLENDPEMREVFQASCETADLLLELQRLRLPVRPQEEPQRCKDCDDCARHAYSDATTPGFFYDKCEKHRLTSKQPSAPSNPAPTSDSGEEK